MERGSDILCFTVSYGNRSGLRELILAARGTAGVWFDWYVCLGKPSIELQQIGRGLLHEPDGTGIQHLHVWEANKGQHFAFKEALDFARENGYKWILRLDDDIQFRSRNWLKKMIDYLEELKALAHNDEQKGDSFYRFIASPKVVGLKNPLQPEGEIILGQKFPAEIMPILGGACRLHPVELLANYEPPLYDPIGRGDPQALARYLSGTVGGHFVRFPSLRVVHRTAELEAKDGPEEALQRKMSKYWPHLSAEV